MAQLTHDYIVTSFESTPSTAGTLYFILAELVTRPELMEELRRELVQITDKDGYLPQTHVSVLPKLDSVMSESSRINIFSYCMSVSSFGETSTSNFTSAVTLSVKRSNRFNSLLVLLSRQAL